jgi:hypothetical protein
VSRVAALVGPGLVQPAGKWDKETRNALGLCAALTYQDLGRKRSKL